MRKSLLPVLVALFPRIMQKLVLRQQGYKNVTQLRMKLFYLRIIKTSRWLFLSFLGIGICLVFLLSSIIIFNITLFFYAPCSMGIKMWLGFLSAAVYLLIAMVAFTSVFTEEKWLRVFNAQNMLKNTQINKHD